MSHSKRRTPHEPHPVAGLTVRTLVDSAEFRSSERAGRVLPVRKEVSTVEVPAEEGEGAADGTVDYILSSETVDRPGDTIRASGWKDDNYRKNPVVLFGHDYSELPVARMKGERVVDGKLYRGKGVEFTPRELYPFGFMVGQMVKGGYLPAGSVGFQPIKWEYTERGISFLEQELLEFSVVPVPANPEALVAAKSVGIEVKLLRSWAEKILDGGGYTTEPREHVAKLRKALAPKSVQVPGRAAQKSEETATEEEELEELPPAAAPKAEGEEEDPLVSSMDRLEAAVRELTTATKAHTAALAKGSSASSTPATTPAATPAAVVEESVETISDRVAKAIEARLKTALGQK